MNETYKCQDMRHQRGDFDKYLKGDGIDIGAGAAALEVPNGSVRVWDRKNGDGQYLDSIADNSLDFVYSSHCLEHLQDVSISLKNWVRVLKPGGYLYIVIPDYTLFEHHLWPSQFNPNHTFSFSLRLSRAKIGRDNHFHIENDVRPIVENLNCKWIGAWLEDNHYNYNLGWIDQTLDKALAQICFVAQLNKEV